MRSIAISLLISLSFFMPGCGEPKFNHGDRDSLTKMMNGMTQSEQLKFIEDANLAATALGGEHKLNGYSVEMIREEATQARGFLNKKNIAFLSKVISDMEATQKTRVNLVVNEWGLFSNSTYGYIPEEYTLADLKKRLLSLGGAPASTPVPENHNTSQDSSTSAINPEKSKNADQLFEDASKQADKEYMAKWKSIRDNPDQFLDNCTGEEYALAIKIGGTDENEAKQRAKTKCDKQLGLLNECMSKPAARARYCFESIFESGD